MSSLRSYLILLFLPLIAACGRDLFDLTYGAMESPDLRQEVNGTLTLQEVKWIGIAASKLGGDRARLQGMTLRSLVEEGEKLAPDTVSVPFDHLRGMTYGSIPREELEAQLAPWITYNDYFSILVTEQHYLGGADSMKIYDMKIGDLIEDARKNAAAYRTEQMGRGMKE